MHFSVSLKSFGFIDVPEPFRSSLELFGPLLQLEVRDDSSFLKLLLIALCSLLKPLVQSIAPLFFRVFAVLKQKVNANVSRAAHC